jgi:WD40 repeat protein
MRSAVSASIIAAVAIVGASCNDETASDEPPGVYVFDLSDGSLERVTGDPGYALAWSEDGSSVIYATAFLPGGDGDVRLVELASHDEERVVDTGSGGFISISNGGDTVAWVGDDMTVRVWRDGDTSELEPGIGVESSPDGAAVLYLTPPCAASQALHVAGVGEPSGEVISSRAFAATWLPDGRIAYRQVQGDPGLPNLSRIYDPETKVTLNAGAVIGFEPQGAYALSPDGAHVLYGGDVNRVFLRDNAAQIDRDLGPGRAQLVAWSPDSLLVAYATFDLLHIATPDGADRYTLDLAQISDDASSSVAIAWSPDGAKIAVVSAPLPSEGFCPEATPLSTPDE